MAYRIEKDFIGELKIPSEALYGIHSLRAKNNFPNKIQFNIEWYKAMGAVKKAVYTTYVEFIQAATLKYGDISKFGLKIIPNNILEALIQAADEVANGEWYEHFIVPAIQGGAGTSINMNINEIIANRALEILGQNHGEYSVIHPVEHANIYQSTNDTVPTALRIAIMRLLAKLEKQINYTRKETEHKEKEFAGILRIGYTQLQAAVPTTYGKLFATYSDALSRDWWRVSKAWERIKEINLGGSAIGTGITVPTFIIMTVPEILRKETGLPLVKSNNLQDTTSNLDSFVEIHAILKAHAVNLKKIADDIRLLAADITKEALKLPPRQTGSSIMPGKVNPVINEYVISIAEKVFANDSLITSLASMTNLELNAYLPVIGHYILESLQLLISANKTLAENLIKDLKIDKEKANAEFYKNPSLATILIPFIGYEKASTLAKLMKKEKITILKANQRLKLIPQEKLMQLIKPSFFLKEGFSLNDFENEKER